MKLALADASGSRRIREIYLDAFDETERGTVADLALALLSAESDPRPISLVAEADGSLVGHIAFSPVYQKGLRRRIGYILAPLAVVPVWQRRGIGTALVREGVRRLALQEADIVFVYGDPSYYQRFGFRREWAENFLPPYPLRHPLGWQALRLRARGYPDEPVAIECVGALCMPQLW